MMGGFRSDRVEYPLNPVNVQEFLSSFRKNMTNTPLKSWGSMLRAFAVRLSFIVSFCLSEQVEFKVIRFNILVRGQSLFRHVQRLNQWCCYYY
jgi:hypothetical protein